jgi:hypothetical protein
MLLRPAVKPAKHCGQSRAQTTLLPLADPFAFSTENLGPVLVLSHMSL